MINPSFAGHVATHQFIGQVYRNGIYVPTRTNYTVKPHGDLFGKPGLTLQEIRDRSPTAANPSGFLVLGDGPVYLALNRAGFGDLYHGMTRLDPALHLAIESCKAKNRYDHPDLDGVSEYINFDYFRATGRTMRLVASGTIVEIYLSNDPGYYTYARLTQLGGIVWQGWCGLKPNFEKVDEAKFYKNQKDVLNTRFERK